MGVNGSTMRKRLYDFWVFCAVIIIARANAQQTEVTFTDRTAVLQIAVCSAKGSKDADFLTLSAKSQEQWQVRADRINPEGRTNNSAIAGWGSLQDPTSLSAGWEQSDALDTQGNDLTCEMSINGETSLLPTDMHRELAIRWEWRRPKGPADAQKKVLIQVKFSYQGDLETALIPGQCPEAGGTMRRFPAKTDDIILYRSLDNDRESLLVVLLPRALEPSVENVHCRVVIDGHSSSCPGPNRTESAATGLHPESYTYGMFCLVGSNVIIILFCLCYHIRRKCRAQSSGPAKADPDGLPLSDTGNQSENENLQHEDDHNIQLMNDLGVREPSMS